VSYIADKINVDIALTEKYWQTIYINTTQLVNEKKRHALRQNCVNVTKKLQHSLNAFPYTHAGSAAF
jgi:uncharacterized cysteine cluster protein YcgN (CxxCxxCC family)